MIVPDLKTLLKPTCAAAVCVRGGGDLSDVGGRRGRGRGRRPASCPDPARKFGKILSRSSRSCVLSWDESKFLIGWREAKKVSK